MIRNIFDTLQNLTVQIKFQLSNFLAALSELALESQSIEQATVKTQKKTMSQVSVMTLHAFVSDWKTISVTVSGLIPSCALGLYIVFSDCICVDPLFVQVIEKQDGAMGVRIIDQQRLKVLLCYAAGVL